MSTQLATKPERLQAALLFAPIADDLMQVERVLAESLAPHRTQFGTLLQHLQHYRGKRLRPALLLLTAEACGGVQPSHPVLAAAVEMIHTATLVHDDVLDEASTRRHVKTVNATWGNTISILLGDMLFSQAYYLASQVDRQACEWIGAATNRVCPGELRQSCERGNLNLNEADYFAIIDGKTAALTEICGRLGAAYAGADAPTTEALASYARHLGLTFQIADDLLDLTGDERVTGKTLGTDMEQQKLTLPLIHCLNWLPASAAEQLRVTLKQGGREARRAVLQSLERTGSVKYARHRADELGQIARMNLECLPPSEARTTLERLTDWALRRDK